jgi:hypothetical protein
VTTRSSPALAAWVLAPLAALALGGLAGAESVRAQRSALDKAAATLPEPQRRTLEWLPALTVANAAWLLGSADSTKKALKVVLDLLPEAEAPRRARTLLRFAAVDQNPEGQAAVISQACATDASICDHLKEVMQEETEQRFASPGNRLPLFFQGGHPPIPRP